MGWKSQRGLAHGYGWSVGAAPIRPAGTFPRRRGKGAGVLVKGGGRELACLSSEGRR
ncbi:hypothetical protein XBLMG947_1028 [Xanthomonas bromi]|uniref:Uncharacterized protein n=1 Tax=Xanthomonas bromi TaxID=56449 RepID=A0A1C3NIK8_9XANT|nr:hypothetical protein XBLMG947_1028 [Xanthomonas bromi]